MIVRSETAKIMIRKGRVPISNSNFFIYELSPFLFVPNRGHERRDVRSVLSQCRWLGHVTSYRLISKLYKHFGDHDT